MKELIDYIHKHSILVNLLEETLQFICREECVVYEKEDLIECDDIFLDWYNIVSDLKKNVKGNMLVKNLNSKLWGVLTQFNRTYVDSDDIEDYDFLFVDDIVEGVDKPEYLCINLEPDFRKYVLVKADNPYKNGGIARIKPWMNSSSRLYITRLLCHYNLLENVVRICTDGVALDKQFEFKPCDKFPYMPLPEDKTTGKIRFTNVNNYFHTCKKCKCEYKYLGFSQGLD